jgi:hypothetical protein
MLSKVECDGIKHIYETLNHASYEHTCGPAGHREKGATRNKQDGCPFLSLAAPLLAMSRRTRFTSVRRRRKPTFAPTSDEGVHGSEAEQQSGRQEELAAPTMMGTKGLRAIAQLLWQPHYGALFELEMRLNQLEAGGSGYELQPTTYRRRLHGEHAERYDRRRLHQERDQLAIALHANNQQHWSPSMLARSVAYFNLASDVINKTEGRQRRIASKPTTLLFLRMMRDCRSVAMKPPRASPFAMKPSRASPWTHAQSYTPLCVLQACALHESATHYIRRFIFEHFFPF